MKKVLIIGSHHSGQKNDPSAIAHGIVSDDVQTTQVYWEDMLISVKTDNVSVSVDGNSIFTDQPDLIIAIGWYKNGAQSIYRDVAFSVALIAQKMGIPFWNSEALHQRSTTKLSCMVQLALEGVSVPETSFCLTAIKALETKEYPFIAKAASASRGMNNYLVENDAILEQVKANDLPFIVQPFLPNDHDLRVICFNGKPALVLRRARQADAETHLNNTSQGGSAKWLELSSIDASILTEAEKICKITGREMAGIDFIPDTSSATGYSCLEVNAVPQLTSGTDSDIKLAAFAQAVREL